MTMKKLNIFEAKTHLSRHLAKLKKGEKIVLCRRNEPIAEIVSLASPRSGPRKIGGDSFKIPSQFFEPMTEEDLLDFEGSRD